MLYILENILLIAAFAGCALLVFILIDKVYDVIEPHAESEISKETGVTFTSQKKRTLKKKTEKHKLFRREVNNAAPRCICR